jgi:hypothetical protein
MTAAALAGVASFHRAAQARQQRHQYRTALDYYNNWRLSKK